MGKILLLFILLSFPLLARAEATFFENTTFPQSIALNKNNIPMEDLSKLKRGEAHSVNMLGLIETGNGGIEYASRNGNIKKIHYVDTKIHKAYIPLWFIPLYYKERVTVVYGE